MCEMRTTEWHPDFWTSTDSTCSWVHLLTQRQPDHFPAVPKICRRLLSASLYCFFIRIAILISIRIQNDADDDCDADCD